MAIGLAFVDIVGDTSRTEAQVESDMIRVLAVVERSLDPVEITAAVEAGTEQNLIRNVNRDIRAAQAAISAIQVDARLDPETRERLTRNLKTAIARARARVDEIKVRVDNRALVQDVVEAAVEAEAAAPAIEIETRIDEDRISRIPGLLSSIGSAASAAVVPVALLSAGLVGIGASVPIIAGTVAAIADMAPATAVLAPTILSVVGAVGALKLAMVGIDDAVKGAFDPSDPEAFAEALKDLSPNAREFVVQLHEMQPAFKRLQLDVQDRVFAGFGESLRDLGKSVLPLVRKNLLEAGTSLNAMAQGVAGAASHLGRTGVLGKALDSASAGLSNLTTIPGNVLTSFVNLATAAGPVFERLTATAAKSFGGVTDRLSAALESGALQKSIEGAVEQVKNLFSVLGNVRKIFHNIAAQAGDFNGILGVVKGITGELVAFTGTKAAQDAFKALFDTVNLLTKTALPLLSQSLGVIGRVIIALQPGVRALLNVLGTAFSSIIAALGPVLESAGQAVSRLAVALSPVVILAGQLISTILPALVPLFDSLSIVFDELSPAIANLSGILASTLVPIFTTLVTQVLPPLLDVLLQLVTAAFPVLNELLVAIQPALLSLGDSFVEIYTAVAPLLTALGTLISEVLAVLLPLLTPVVEILGKLASIFANEVARVVRDIVVPAIQIFTNLLQGDFQAALDSAKQLAIGFGTEVVRIFLLLPLKIGEALLGLGKVLLDTTGRAFVALNVFLINKLADVVQFFREIPGKILSALGNLENLLVNAGASILRGLMQGVRNKIGELRDLFSGITDLIPSWKGPADRDRKLLTPAGQMIIESLMAGIASSVPALRGQLAGITSMVGGTQMSLPGLSAGVGGIPTGTSTASRFAAATTPTGASGGGVPMVQVFLGTQEIRDIVDVRVAAANRASARQVSNGMRR